MAPRLVHALASLVTLVVVAAGCGGGDTLAIDDYVTAVTTADGTVTATFHRGAPPVTDSVPAAVVATNPVVIPGGSTRATVTAGGELAVVTLAIDGVDGYYELRLPAGAAAAQLVIRLSQDLEVAPFSWVFGVGGAPTLVPVDVIAVGTGDVQVSLSWNSAADVDLHVIDPLGEEIFWITRGSSSGGALDLDSNAACFTDGPRNENITWPVGIAPAGAYTVRVDYWSSCGEPATDYVVTVNTADQAPATFAGTFTGDGDMGGANAGVWITDFSFGAAARTAAPREPAPLELVGAVDVRPVPGAPRYAK